MPSIEAMWITLARWSVAAALSSGVSAWVRKKGVFMFRSATLSQPLSGNSAYGAPQAAPALFTRMSRLGSCCWYAATRALMPSSVDTSAGSDTQGPMADSSLAVASQASALRAEM